MRYPLDSKHIIEHPLHSGYACDSDGNLYGRRTGHRTERNGLLDYWRPVKAPIMGNGYALFTFYSIHGSGPKLRKRMMAHRFIWECFNGVITDRKLEINHINRDPADNRLSNLELVTHSQNMKHAPLRGGANPMAKYNRDLVEAVKVLRDNGWSLSKISRAFQIDCGYISNIANGKVWGHII